MRVIRDVVDKVSDAECEHTKAPVNGTPQHFCFVVNTTMCLT